MPFLRPLIVFSPSSPRHITRSLALLHPVSTRSYSRGHGASSLPTAFERVALPRSVAQALRLAYPHVATPTQAQRDLIPAMLNGDNILFKGRTGSGKSFGLALALLAQVYSNLPQYGSGFKSLLVVPHRDLAFQYHHWMTRILGHLSDVKSSTVTEVVQVIARGHPRPSDGGLTQITIATPQGLLDLLEERSNAAFSSHLDGLFGTVVLDEVDAMLDFIPTEASTLTKRQIFQRMRRHPRDAKVLLDRLFKGTGHAKEVQTDGPWRSSPSPSKQGASQLVMCSATFHGGLRQELWNSGWFDGDRDLVKIKVQDDEQQHALEKAEADELAATGVMHCGLVVSDNGDVRNIEGAVAAPIVSQGMTEEERVAAETEMERAFEEDEGAVILDWTDIPAKLVEKFSTQPSPLHGPSLEAIATAFAVDVAQLALLVLPSTASVYRAVYELRLLGVNAHALELRAVDRGGGHLSQGPERVFDGNPTLLVSTLMTTRGLDLVGLSHVFILGVPEDRRVDAYSV
ncbi:P-loop containing nucleoside triphosphate hydrolase protein [Amylostereum chailletii]|nr:P-loop containing nucleoside triphosphate hydrolase protein [Amylostereum chailletii]